MKDFDSDFLPSVWFIAKHDGEGMGPFIVGGIAYDNHAPAFHVWTTLREECPDNKYDLIELKLVKGNLK